MLPIIIEGFSHPFDAARPELHRWVQVETCLSMLVLTSQHLVHG